MDHLNAVGHDLMLGSHGPTLFGQSEHLLETLYSGRIVVNAVNIVRRLVTAHISMVKNFTDLLHVVKSILPVLTVAGLEVILLGGIVIGTQIHQGLAVDVVHKAVGEAVLVGAVLGHTGESYQGQSLNVLVQTAAHAHEAGVTVLMDIEVVFIGGEIAGEDLLPLLQVRIVLFHASGGAPCVADVGLYLGEDGVLGDGLGIGTADRGEAHGHTTGVLDPLYLGGKLLVHIGGEAQLGGDALTGEDLVNVVYDHDQEIGGMELLALLTLAVVPTQVRQTAGNVRVVGVLLCHIHHDVHILFPQIGTGIL